MKGDSRLMTTNSIKVKKNQKLRNNEYYDIQQLFDELYMQSKSNKKFKNLYELILNENNIKLAYRNIKRNKGASTSGTNEHTIMDIEEEEINKVVKYVKDRLTNYVPHSIRRVEIPKPNGKVRPLGIPTIEDRLIQECIKQILEPICEAKFHPHSYGFRPNRSTEHAISRVQSLMNNSQLHYVVDIDIKSFFDNVNHGKLLKQMWNLGIQDKRVISIISKMLKAEVKGIGKTTKGTPQGGILSPLLSNIVLNELDWWISNQWETFETEHKYSGSNHKFVALKKTNLKEIYIVRYADDFKILCRNYNTAKKIFVATQNWLKERLGLEISEDKSKITNVKHNYTEFLGLKLKVVKKQTKVKSKNYVSISHMSNKAKDKATNTIRKRIKELQKKQDRKTINRYNSTILGLHNYYRIATRVSEDFKEIAYICNRVLYNRLVGRVTSENGQYTQSYKRLYGNYNYKTYYVQGIALFPTSAVKNKIPLGFTQQTCNYTEEGRKIVHDKLSNEYSKRILKYLLNNPVEDESIEYNDNRISLYIAQKGRCAITQVTLEIGDIECHHKKPKKSGGNDRYENLIIISKNVHKLIHATNQDIINKYLNLVKPNKKQLKEINKLRKFVGNVEI